MHKVVCLIDKAKQLNELQSNFFSKRATQLNQKWHQSISILWKKCLKNEILCESKGICVIFLFILCILIREQK